MIRKLFILILLFLLNNCGYQPLFVSNDLENIEFQEFNLIGDNRINKKIISKIKVVENKLSLDRKKLLLSNDFNVIETSRNSKGIIETYRSSLLVNIKIIENDKIIKEKTITKNFNYNKKDNKFELVKYQNNIMDTLINQVAQDLIIFLKVQ